MTGWGGHNKGLADANKITHYGGPNDDYIKVVDTYKKDMAYNPSFNQMMERCPVCTKPTKNKIHKHCKARWEAYLEPSTGSPGNHSVNHIPPAGWESDRWPLAKIPGVHR